MDNDLVREPGEVTKRIVTSNGHVIDPADRNHGEGSKIREGPRSKGI